MIRQLKYGLTQLFLLAHKMYLKASLPLASVSNLSYPLSGLTLIGMRGDTFISLFFLDQILSADSLSKISKKKLEVRIGLI